MPGFAIFALTIEFRSVRQYLNRGAADHLGRKLYLITVGADYPVMRGTVRKLDFAVTLQRDHASTIAGFAGGSATNCSSSFVLV